MNNTITVNNNDYYTYKFPCQCELKLNKRRVQNVATVTGAVAFAVGAYYGPWVAGTISILTVSTGMMFIASSFLGLPKWLESILIIKNIDWLGNLLEYFLWSKYVGVQNTTNDLKFLLDVLTQVHAATKFLSIVLSCLFILRLYYSLSF